MRYLAKDMQPFYTLERVGFKELVHELDSQYKMPSRRHFVDKEFPTLYYEVKDKVIQAMSGVKYYADHTGQTVADTICDILLNWVLSVDDLVATTTDNGSNFVSAFDKILKWPRISCFGHIDY